MCWMHGCRDCQIGQIPVDLGIMWLPGSTKQGQLMCTPWEYASEPCLINGTDLLPWEWNHIKEQQVDGTYIADEQLTISTLHAQRRYSSSDVLRGSNLTNQIVAD